MFLSWVIGEEPAKEAIRDGYRIEEDQVNCRPEDVSSAIIEKDVHENFQFFQGLFTDDAWEAVMALGTIVKNCQI